LPVWMTPDYFLVQFRLFVALSIEASNSLLLCLHSQKCECMKNLKKTHKATNFYFFNLVVAADFFAGAVGLFVAVAAVEADAVKVDETAAVEEASAGFDAAGAAAAAD
jgi:hypothetical protein